ncbi:Flavin-dependent oxidoreductase, luciferase family (includes alkanesulfonate monooxygenase SsuD and methylene tetrahydromethanopterin reductase) [Roseovarius nanhaiticus]|uniref:Flavin-dependent oxidoreductase, luciferase family (Includes alkanesulfonate monooxygenase SsuD and methylene tetrahydromethanopterin reductase) n=1 Tax=Roseovarius nanhaiticus TaxID=573024 RepID=A0A1N7H5P2_9RHOB|nr:LLM class flavin-dependent oxidoreductase [Roseovarius nanhaiticus]SEL12092.1 Flavin-dependent oxidoreductase, luciferase family (includes alkanesulfonate monooxygenase SsuD and methylene tetrahydromethanopterin reductase) [Roseovarius nanhaiticus]SIS20111.1 Flavin-dependent oxidoreductase, luciferase family (includes alkanesulfonate monooxygenase SsuD and methylene tetrahydromethanopterin reductase) [Roseovarius nanhaiticus]
MDFSLFAHMERTSADQDQRALRGDLIALAKMADEGGMRAIWTGEHHGMDFTISPNPFMSLVDLSYHTKNLRLGTGTVIAPFWHPIALAGEAAAADLITDGRIELGVARGAYSYEYERLSPGLDAWDAGQRMREMTPLLRQLWAGDCAHEGTFYHFPSTTSAPKPVQPDGPPIWIAARDINSHAFGVENGFNIQVTPLWKGLDEIESLMAKFNEACANHGGARPKIMLLHHTYVGSDADDIQVAAKEISEFYCYFGAWFQNKRPVRQGLIETLTEDDMAANTMMSPQNMLRDLTMGTAQEVIDQIRQYEDLGYDEFAFWIDSGMSFERKRASLARFIDDVMPAFA